MVADYRNVAVLWDADGLDCNREARNAIWRWPQGDSQGMRSVRDW